MSRMPNGKPVNVASVPQRSPFRYPGGKTWLVPHIRKWMAYFGQKPERFIEPFAGGAIVGLTAAFEQLADKVILVELDENVAAVWKTILSRNASWLANRILDFDITVDNIREELAKPKETIRQRAFCTILRNRTFHGGIMADGSSLIKYGESGKGVASRWYPDTLARRIRDIHEIRKGIEFAQGDGLRVIEENLGSRHNVFFIDPPYTASKKQAGSRLYNHSKLDHERLFDLITRARGDFLMTYDDDDAVRAMAEQRGFEVATVPMQSRRLNTMYELLISKDLEWERQQPVERQMTLF